MAEAEPAPVAPARPPLTRQAAHVALEGAALAFLIAIAAGVVGVRSREEAAEQFAESWLRQHGVEGDVEVSRIDAAGFSGKVRLGPADDPDLVADRIDVDYVLVPPWAGPAFSVTPRSIRLIHPQAKASFDGRQLHFGSLDPLIRQLLKAPKTKTPAPDIRIDDGSLSLSTPYGLVQVDDTQANLAQGRLTTLETHLLRSDLKSGASRAVIAGGLIRLEGDGASLDGTTELTFEALAAGRTRLERTQARLDVTDLKYDLAPGVVGLSAQAKLAMQASSLAIEGAAAANPRMRADIPYFQATLGPTTNGRFDAIAQLSADGFTGPASLQGILADVTAKGATFSTGSGGPRVRAPLRIRFAADAAPVAGSGLVLAKAKGDLTGRLDTAAGSAVTGVASLTAQGTAARHDAERLAQNARILGQEPKYQAALASALERFTLSAPRIEVSLGKRFALVPRQPVTLAASSGAKLVLTPEALHLGPSLAGGFSLRLEGGGLPPATLEASGLRQSAGALSMHAALTTRLDIGPAKQAEIALSGTASYGGSRFVLVADKCADLSAAYLDLGENRVEGPSGKACPVPGAPLIDARGAAWRLEAELHDGKAEVPFLQARTAGAKGRVSVFGQAVGIGAQVALAEAPIFDTTDPRRFEPLHARGSANLDHDVWKANLAIATAQNQPIGSVVLVQDTTTGTGTAEIDASHLVFARGGLQPADVTPVAALLANAQGQAAFTGHMDWNKDQPVEGTGRLVVGRLDFSSPVGPVSGLKGEVAFTSLAPLVSGANQSVTADLIDAFAPLKNVNATFTLAEDGLHLASAQAEVAGGRANLEPMTLPFAQQVTIAGAFGLDDINLNDLVALTSYADRIKTDLILDGRLPFEVDDRGIRLLKGRLATVKPGRISIARELLTGVESGQATAQVQTAPNAAVAEAPATNAVQDLTYDVLENLAVDSLSATVESLPSGRLGALFSIKGRFDPAKAPKTTLPLTDLILGKPLDKIPLAKGTPVDLTLDTSLNFDELVKGVESSFDTFKDLHQPSRSGPVQR